MNASQVIGRYEIIEELGRGAMGSVFKARDPVVGRIVALKTIHTAALAGEQSDEYRSRFYREARASGVLAHPGIVPVFDVGEHDGAPFLVMEFVDGRTLADAIKKSERYSLDRVCEIVQQIAEALGYAHRQGVIHRDVKPANILMTSREVYGSERPRITDFGIAKMAASEITTSGQLLGTPSYMPPEQFTGSPLDGRADLFSLGVILYSLTTGEQPFAGETMTAVSYKVVYTEPIPPTKLNPATPHRLEGAILKALSKNPAERFQTGEEFAQELMAIRAGKGAVAAQSVAPEALDADATLGPAAAPAAVKAARAASAAKAASQPVAAPAAKKAGKPVQFETIFGIILLSVAGLAAAGALTWYIFEHALSIAHRASGPPVSQPVAQPVAPPAPVFPIPQPDTTTPVTTETQPAAGSHAAAMNIPAPAGNPETTTPAQEAKHSATGKAAASTVAKPKANSAAPSPTPASAGQSSAAVASSAKSTPAPASTTAAASATNVPAGQKPAPVFDPRKLDPNTSAKLKIELGKFPNGFPFAVEMNKQPYLNFVTGDKTGLDNLYIPQGVQEFRVKVKSGGQEYDSNIVSQDFKAKKRINLKIEIMKNGNTPSKISLPLSNDDKIYLSLSSPLF
jgi:predicted Ser/Thr protein kinase